MNEGNRRIRGYIRIGRGLRPPGDGLSLQNSRGSPWLPGARRRIAHLSNLPRDIPEETTPPTSQSTHITRKTDASVNVVTSCVTYVRARACSNYPGKLHAKLSPHGQPDDIKGVKSNSPGPSAFNVKLFHRCNLCFLVKEREMPPL